MRLFFILTLLLCISCSSKVKYLDQDLEKIPFIPLPQKIESLHSSILVNDINYIQTEIKSQRFETVLNDFKIFWKESTSSNISENNNFKKNIKSIRLNLGSSNEEMIEFYSLEIDEKGVLINSNNEEGIYRGLTTLKQIIIFSKLKNNLISIPTGKIIDYASYKYRGSMLDVSRHFFGMEDVKRYIDILSFYKINFLHLHLSYMNNNHPYLLVYQNQ